MAKARRHSSATLGTSWPDGIGWQRQPLRRSAKKRGRADRIAMQCSAVQEPSLSMLAQKQRIENAQWIVAERDSAGSLALSGSGLAEADLGTWPSAPGKEPGMQSLWRKVPRPSWPANLRAHPPRRICRHETLLHLSFTQSVPLPSGSPLVLNATDQWQITLRLGTFRLRPCQPSWEDAAADFQIRACCSRWRSCLSAFLPRHFRPFDSWSRSPPFFDSSRRNLVGSVRVSAARFALLWCMSTRLAGNRSRRAARRVLPGLGATFNAAQEPLSNFNLRGCSDEPG